MAFGFLKNIFAPFLGSAISGGLQNKAQKSGKWSQLYTKDENQRAAQNQALQMGLSQLQNPYEGYQPIEDQARTNFQTQTIPSIAERFTAMGNGAQRSSAFTGALGSAGAGLEQSLAALKSQYGFQNKQLGAGLLGQGLESNYENLYTHGGETFGSSVLGGLSQGLGAMGQAGIQQYGSQPIANAIKNKKPNNTNINQTLNFMQQRQSQQRQNPIDSMMPQLRGY